MKILHVIPSLSPSRGGPTAAVRAMAEGLVALGAHVDIATTDDDGPEAREVNAPAFRNEAGTGVYRFGRWSRFYTFSPDIASWLAKHVSDYDLLHLHALFNWPTTAASWIARQRRVPYVVRPLGTISQWGFQNRRPALKRLSFSLIEKNILERAALVHLTSEAERLASADCGARFRSIVIPNAVPLFQPLRRARVAIPNILFLSRFDPVKGLDILLPAFAMLAARIPDVTLTLAGDGPPDFVHALRESARALGLISKVIFTGFLQGEAKAAAFAGADIFVLPSRSESFGIAAVEAMAAGVPVIVSLNVPLHKEIVASGAGIAVPCEPEALSYAMESLLTNQEARDRMGHCGREHVRRNFSPQVVAHSLLSAYKEILGAA